MARAPKKPPRAAVLLELDAELLGRFDALWRAAGFPSRRSAIRHALEVRLADHAASVQRDRAVAAQPAGSFTRPSPDSVLEQQRRPITATLRGM